MPFPKLYRIARLYDHILCNISELHRMMTKRPGQNLFGFLKANLRLTHMSVRGKEKVENELGFTEMKKCFLLQRISPDL